MIKTLALSALMLGVAGSASANLIANGGFELPVAPGKTLDDWTLRGQAIQWDCDEAHTGNCSLALALTPGVGGYREPDQAYQSFETVAGDRYAVSLFYKTNCEFIGSTPEAFSSGDVKVISGDGQAERVALDATLQGGSSWARYDGVFTATGSDSQIQLRGLGLASQAGSNYFNVDDVVITASPVPEPGSVALLLTGLSLLAVRQRRRG